MILHNFYTENPKKGSVFVAFFDDGSGANLFNRDDEGDYRNARGVLISQTWFLDSGYCDFAYLPTNYKLFYEQNGETK